jgi:hypothetical protein
MVTVKGSVFSLIVAFLLVCLNNKQATGDFFTSVGKMTKLVETEAHLTNSLKMFIDFQQKRLDEARECKHYN